MDLLNLYPTATTYTVDDIDFEYTDTLANLASTYGLNVAHPYVMGYIPIDYSCSVTKLSVIESYDDDNYMFKAIGDVDNYPWFFLCHYTTSLTPTQLTYLIYDSETTNPWNVLGTNTTYSFVNSMSVQSLGQYNVTLRFGHLSTNTSTGTISGSTGLQSLAIVDYNFSTPEAFFDWLNGDTDYIEIQIGYAPNNSKTFKISAKLNPTDPDAISIFYGNANTTETATVSGQEYNYDVNIFIVDYRIPLNRIYGNNDNAGNYANMIASMQIHDTENSLDYIACLGDRLGNTQPVLRVSNSNFNNTAGDFGHIILNDVTYYKGGFSGTFPKDLFSGSNRVYQSGNFIIYKASSYSYFFRCIEPEEIRSLIQISGLRYVQSTTKFGTGTGIYFPLYNADNSPKMELLDGDAQDINPQLRDWQIYNVNYNEFKWDDIPIYVPPGPTPDDQDEESGDSIGLQKRYFTGASNFITQYAMTDSQVGVFGQLLWTSWFNNGSLTNMWQNFVLVVAGGQQSDTGSYDVSSVMDFIVSLQIFPFSLDAALAVDTNQIKIGMGAFPLQIGSTMRKILTTVIYLDFGTIKIPRPHADFRDYENMTISAVLPYCGTCELNPGDVIGRSLSCTYCVDLQTGNCHAIIMAYDDNGHYYPCASLDGQLSANIALSATNESRLKAQRTMDAVNFAKAFTSPVLSIGNAVSGLGSSSGGIASSLTDWAFLPDYITAEKISRGAISCPSISGGNGLSAFMQPEQPYVQMRYGIYSKPDNYLNSEGRPNTTSGVLSSFSGFTVCKNVNVDTIHCHSDERAAIKVALESGVYL